METKRPISQTNLAEDVLLRLPNVASVNEPLVFMSL